MKKRGILITAGILAIILSSLLLNTQALAKNVGVYNEFLARHSLYRSIVTYFRYAKETMNTYSFNYKDLLLMVIMDLPLSFLFLWLGLRSLAGRRRSEVKNYAWFLLAINISRFLSFLVFYVAWVAIQSFIIVLRPEWKAPFTDIFSIHTILIFFVVYVWLLARTFSLNVFGALKVFFISHALYCAVVALFLFVVPDNRIASFVDKNMGFRPIIQGYLMDVGKISKGDSAFSLIRIRTYHM